MVICIVAHDGRLHKTIVQRLYRILIDHTFKVQTAGKAELLAPSPTTRSTLPRVSLSPWLVVAHRLDRLFAFRTAVTMNQRTILGVQRVRRMSGNGEKILMVGFDKIVPVRQ